MNDLLKRYSFNVVANDFILAGKGSSSIKNLLKSMGINANVIRRIAIVSYEAEINIVIHSYGGKLHCDLYDDRILIISEDIGPGIKNLELALTEGYSTAPESIRELGFGAGMGLPNMKKYADYFEIKSSSKGTIIKITVLL
jgi:anti-sigma regulatory factor (Ser/Thr protein kinase)